MSLKKIAGSRVVIGSRYFRLFDIFRCHFYFWQGRLLLRVSKYMDIIDKVRISVSNFSTFLFAYSSTRL